MWAMWGRIPENLLDAEAATDVHDLNILHEHKNVNVSEHISV